MTAAQAAMEMSEDGPDIFNEGYISIPTWTHSQNLLTAAEALSLKISSPGLSLKWSITSFQSAQHYSKAMQWKRASHEFGGKSIETETITWSEFHTSVRWMK